MHLKGKVRRLRQSRPIMSGGGGRDRLSTMPMAAYHGPNRYSWYLTSKAAYQIADDNPLKPLRKGSSALIPSSSQRRKACLFYPTFGKKDCRSASLKVNQNMLQTQSVHVRDMEPLVKAIEGLVSSSQLDLNSL